jgi:hypothetical protein
MTAVTTEPVLDEFDLDIQIDDANRPDPTHFYPTVTVAFSCTACCPTVATVCCPTAGCPIISNIHCN